MMKTLSNFLAYSTINEDLKTIDVWTTLTMKEFIILNIGLDKTWLAS